MLWVIRLFMVLMAILFGGAAVQHGFAFIDQSHQADFWRACMGVWSVVVFLLVLRALSDLE